MKRQRRSSAGRIQGWSVVETGRRAGASARDGNVYLRRFWTSRRGGFYRLALVALAAWGTYNLVGSTHGLLRLRALEREEAVLQVRYQQLTQEALQVQHELQEDPALSLERGLREKYLKSRPDEIVYQAKRVRPPAAADSAAGAPGSMRGAAPVAPAQPSESGGR